MASIRKHGRGYQVRIKIKGAPHQSKTLPTKQLAKEWAVQTEDQIYRGIFFGPGYTKTFRDAVTHYLDRVAPVFLTPKTIETHRTALELWCASGLGEMLLASITTADIIDRRDGLVGRLTNASINRYFTALSSVMSMCEEREWIATNPCRRIRKLPDDSKRDVALTKKQRSALLGACADRSFELYLLVLAALETGARRGELEKLTLEDCNIETNCITLRNTKNGDTRTIPLSNRLANYVRLFVERGGRHRAFDPLNQTHWDEARRACDLSHVRFHDLRHTFATEAVKAGHNIRKIAAMLGHRNLNMMMRYSHLQVEDLRDLVK